MDAIRAIHTRRSVRKFLDEPVPDDLVQEALSAAMMAPSARNAQPWQFVLIDDKAMLEEYATKHTNAKMAKDAPLAILVCGDLSLERSQGYWPLDCAAAVENLLLAVHSLGLGAVWTGVYPREPRIQCLREMCHLPSNVIPHSLVVLGYPENIPAGQARFQADRVHRNRWTPPNEA